MSQFNHARSVAKYNHILKAQPVKTGFGIATRVGTHGQIKARTTARATTFAGKLAREPARRLAKKLARNLAR